MPTAVLPSAMLQRISPAQQKQIGNFSSLPETERTRNASAVLIRCSMYCCHIHTLYWLKQRSARPQQTYDTNQGHTNSQYIHRMFPAS
jgi:hypothetical protein